MYFCLHIMKKYKPHLQEAWTAAPCSAVSESFSTFLSALSPGWSSTPTVSKSRNQSTAIQDKGQGQ